MKLTDMAERITDGRFKYKLIPFLSTLLVLAAGCNTTPTKPAKSNVQGSRVRELEQELRRTQSALDDLRERNLVLERKDANASKRRAPAPSQDQMLPSEVAAVENVVKSAPPPPAPFAPSPPKELPPRVTSKPEAPVQQSGEQKLYSKVLESYRSHKPAEIQKSAQLLLKAYPDSVHADNALYMSGLLAIETGDLPHAAQYMDRVVREYPEGNKAVAALFGKAMIEKNRKNFRGALSILKTLRDKYPGSPEAARSQTESKIISMVSSTRKGG